ncbi:hypothetical protein [Streptomyces scopuliridis]|uniref:hypothetical protein n=1 Tax=Streptomyces scopuliridis TaxID=452529 RepID=UPI003421E3F3
MRKNDQLLRKRVQLAAEAGRDRQIHREFERLLPGQYRYAGLREQLGHPGPER